VYQGLLKPATLSPLTWENYWAKVVRSEHGYVWIASVDSQGYGKFWIPERKKLVGAHRVVYMWAHGEIKNVIDHTCSIPRCVTLEHLEDVTQQENLQRTWDRGRHPNPGKEKTHCKWGHEFTEENTYVYGNKRGCRRCRNNNVYKSNGRLDLIRD
jgi:hypothetical protein